MKVRIIIWMCFLSLCLIGCNSQSVVNDINETASVEQDILSEEESSNESEEVTNIEKDPEQVSSEVVLTEEVLTVKTPLLFSIDLIHEDMAKEMMGKSYHENEHIQLEDLRYVQTGYFGFDGEEHQGALVVHQSIAKDILDIFQALFDARYPIEQMVPIDMYGGDDDASMVANNTSAFNYRVVAGTDRLSKHAYGLAVDINPLINPWVTKNGIYPPEGSIYADRTKDEKGMIKKGDPCYEAFTSRGFEWGGDWANSKDYQHFDISTERINQ